MTNDPEPDLPEEELVRGALGAAEELARAGDDAEAHEDQLWRWIRALQRSGGEAVLHASAEWARSPLPHARALAAHVVAQLHPSLDSLEFAARCTDVVLPLLEDPDPEVLASAITALGHLYRSERPWDVAAVTRHAAHPVDDVRDACCHALGGDPAEASRETLDALVGLFTDPVDEIRDWAVFGAGVLCDVDRPDLREALAARLADPHGAVRAEAVLALAKRRDPRAPAAIARALAEQDVWPPVVEAAMEWPDPRHLEALRGIQASIPDLAYLPEAIEACERASDASSP